MNGTCLQTDHSLKFSNSFCLEMHTKPFFQNFFPWRVAVVSNGLQLIGDSQSFSIFLLLVILTISPNLDAVNLQLLSSNHRLLEICPGVFFFKYLCIFNLWSNMLFMLNIAYYPLCLFYCIINEEIVLNEQLH